MATKTVNFDKAGIQTIVKGVTRPIRNARPYFQMLGTLVDTSTQLTFRLKGARSGMSKWIDYGKGKGVEVYRFNSGKWAKRRGTDGSTSRRYSKKSQMLQASGGFRKSFKTLKTSKDRMYYGSNMTNPDAKDIMSNPIRNVLFVTRGDRRQWQSQWRVFIDRGIKF